MNRVFVLVPNLINNGSFEIGTFVGWENIGNITLVGVPTASDGNLSAAFSFGNLPNNGILSQSFATIPGQVYTLRFEFGTNGDFFIEQSLQVEVLGSSVLLDETVRTQGPPIEFNAYTYTFVSDSDTTTLQFTDQSDATYRIDAQLDNVSVSGPALNLIRNGSFESGDFTSWENIGNITVVGVPAASDGNLSAAFSFGNLPNNGILSQSFATVPGQFYTLEFDFGTNGDFSIEQSLQVEVLGSSILLDETVSTQGPPIEFNPYTYTFVADSDTTTLQFSDQSDATYRIDAHLDNVSVITGQELFISTAGLQGFGQNPLYEVWVDGQKVGDTISVSANHRNNERQVDTIHVPYLTATSEIEIRFINDRWNSQTREDRNLYIHSIAINSDVLNLDKAKYYVSWRDTPFQGRRDMLWNGSFIVDVAEQFATAGSRSTDILGNTLTVTARGTDYLGLPEMTVLVDGTEIGRTIVTEDSVTYSFDISGVIYPEHISIGFLNDQWNPETLEDRNLIIEEITLGTASLDPQDADYIVGNGQQRPSQSIMHFNGELQFLLSEDLFW
ncbi:MAG: carbohydrate-binding domain-containing protein [Bacteroidota bacterium]